MDVAIDRTLEEILVRWGAKRTKLVEILHDIQHERGWLAEPALRTVAARLGIAIIEVYRVATFYKAFSLAPRGRHVLTVCDGTACHVRGSEKLLDEVQGRVGIRPGETTPDGELTLETVNCLGACALGPVAVLDGVYHHHVTYSRLRSLLAGLAGRTDGAGETDAVAAGSSTAAGGSAT